MKYKIIHPITKKRIVGSIKNKEYALKWQKILSKKYGVRCIIEKEKHV